MDVRNILCPLAQQLISVSSIASDSNLKRRKCLETSTPEDLLLVIAGSGHIDYRFGVPERVDRYGLVPKDQTCIVTVRYLIFFVFLGILFLFLMLTYISVVIVSIVDSE